MIISHYHKFVFVKTNKTAGSSLEALLTQYLQPGDMITTRNDMDIGKEIDGRGLIFLNGEAGSYRKSFANHSPLSDAHKTFPETRKYFSFGVIRNPFSRYESSFRWRTQKKIKKILTKTERTDYTETVEDSLQKLFKNFVREGNGKLNERGRNLLHSCEPNTGQCWSVNQIIQLERIEMLNGILKQKAGLDIDIRSMPKLKSNVIKIPKNINIMTEETIAIIKTQHEWEVNTFNYQPNNISPG